MNGDLRVGLFIEGNAAGGQAAAASVRSAVAGMKLDVQAAAEQFAGLDRNQKSAEASAQVFITALDAERAKFNAIRASMDPVFAGNQRYEEILTQTRSAVQLGAVSQEEANVVLDRAAQRYGKVTKAVGLNRIQQLEAMHVSRELVTMWASGIPIEQAFGMEAGRIATFFQSGDGGVTGALTAATEALGVFLDRVIAFAGPWGLVAAGIAAASGAVFSFVETWHGAELDLSKATADVKKLTTAMSGLDGAERNASMSTSELLTKYGALSPLAMKVIENQRSIAQFQTQAALIGVDKTVSKQFGDFTKPNADLNVAEIASGQGAAARAGVNALFGGFDPTKIKNVEQELKISRDDAVGLAKALQEVGQAKTSQQIVDSLEKVRNSILDSTGGLHSMNDNARKFYGLILQTEEQALKLANIDTASKLLDAVSAARALKTALAGAAAEAKTVSDAEAAMQNAALSADRRMQENRIRAQNGNSTAGKIRTAGQIAGIEFDAQQPDISGLDPIVQQQLSAQRAAARKQVVADAQTSEKYALQSSAAANTQRRSINDVIASLKAEHTAIATLDPVQLAMLHYRRQLATATDAQRAAVKELVTENIAEKNAVRAAQEAQGAFSSAAYTGIDDLVFKAKTLKDAFLDVANSIWEAFMKAELLGSGPLSGILGTKSTTGTGGLLGDIFQAIFPATSAASVGGTAEHLIGHAAGGYLTGPGTGTSDSILMWGSNGEFMVNAAATSKHRALLEAINADALPAFASGGIVGMSGPVPAVAPPASAKGKPSAMDLHIHVHGAQGNAEVREMVRQGVQTGLQWFNDNVLPFSIKQHHEDPWSVG